MPKFLLIPNALALIEVEILLKLPAFERLEALKIATESRK